MGLDLDEDGDDYNEEDSGVESGFGRDSPRPLSPPPPEQEKIIRSLPWTPKVSEFFSYLTTIPHFHSK